MPDEPDSGTVHTGRTRIRVRKLVLGLLSDLPRKNRWTIAECRGEDPGRHAAHVDEDLVTEEYLGLHEAFEELGASTRLVCVFFTADAENGIHALHRGDAHLEPDRTFTWPYGKQLPVAPAQRERRAVAPPPGHLWRRLTEAWAVPGPCEVDRR